MRTTAWRLIDAFLTGGDTPSATAQLAPDAIFHSPIRDYAGVDQIASVRQAVAGVITDARPTSVHERPGETNAFFVGAIRQRPVDGVLRTLTDIEERVSDITLMIRPWSALKAGNADIGSVHAADALAVEAAAVTAPRPFARVPVVSSVPARPVHRRGRHGQ